MMDADMTAVPDEVAALELVPEHLGPRWARWSAYLEADGEVRSFSPVQFSSSPREHFSGVVAYSFVYLTARPLAFSTGYLAAFLSILALIVSSRSMPRLSESSNK